VRLLVAGAGAVGGYYGAALAEHGHDVAFVARGDHLAAMQTRGLTIRSGGRTRILAPVRAVAKPAEAGGGEVDLVLFTVKGQDTEAAALALRAVVGPGTAVLTLQNGVESGERLAAVLGAGRVLEGTTVISARVAEPGVIEQMGPPPRIVLGEPAGPVTPRVQAVADAFRDAGVVAEATAHVRRAVWEKFIRLAPGATLTSACQSTIGEARDTPEGGALYRALIAETVAVGRAAGVDLPADAVDGAVAFIASLPAAMKISMQLDFERRRRGELDEITGAVVRLGRRLGVATPTYDALHGVLAVRAATFAFPARPA
jgi:2-dehydropantoate 2-reductase